jgi:hypothetical protein
VRRRVLVERRSPTRYPGPRSRGRYFDVYPDERGFWDAFIDTAEEYDAHEKAQSFFSAPHRLRPLEHYLA